MSPEQKDHIKKAIAQLQDAQRSFIESLVPGDPSSIPIAKMIADVARVEITATQLLNEK